METFKASVQYGDWEGTAAADDADRGTLTTYLEKEGLLGEDQFLLGSSLWVGENHGGKLGSITITAYIFDKPSDATVSDALAEITSPIPVRAVELEMSIEEYIGHFKRFKVTHTRKYFNLEGREFTRV